MVGATIILGAVVAGTVVGGFVGTTVGATVGGETVVGGTVVIGVEDGTEADALTTVETGTGKVDAGLVGAAGGKVAGDPKLDDPATLEADTFFCVAGDDAPWGDGTGAACTGAAGATAAYRVESSRSGPILHRTIY